MQIALPKGTIEAFCKKNKIRRMAFFGSVLRDDFSPESDVDVLVEFEPDAAVGLIGLAGLEIELSRILGRKADIHTIKGLNPHFRENVLDSAEVQYERA